jgi:hypothetical protein
MLLHIANSVKAFRHELPMPVNFKQTTFAHVNACGLGHQMASILDAPTC